jgi:hypothetical protein
MRIYQQVLDMGDAGVEMLEAVIGCTLTDAFTPFLGAGFCPAIVPRAKKCLPARCVERTGRRRNRLVAGDAGKRLMGLEPTTFCMAKRT